MKGLNNIFQDPGLTLHMFREKLNSQIEILGPFMKKNIYLHRVKSLSFTYLTTAMLRKDVLQLLNLLLIRYIIVIPLTLGCRFPLQYQHIISTTHYSHIHTLSNLHTPKTHTIADITSAYSSISGYNLVFTFQYQTIISTFHRHNSRI